MKFLNYLYILIIAILLFGCKDLRKKTTNDSQEVYNFVILLDLSDRILIKDQPEIDKELIAYIYSLFENKVKKNIFIYSKDKLKIVLPEQKDFTVDPVLLQKELNFDLTNIDNEDSSKFIKKKNYIIGFKEKFKHALDALYDTASIYTKSKQFKGVDMWKYFNQNLEYDLINDSNVRNYLFVFTDGYFDFEDYKNQKKVGNKYTTSIFLKELRLKKEKWEEVFDNEGYGLLPVKAKFKNTSILILEVNPKVDFIDEFDMINKMWCNWLDEMDVKKKCVLKKNRIETTKEQIKKFIEIN